MQPLRRKPPAAARFAASPPPPPAPPAICTPISTPLSTSPGANTSLASPNNVYSLTLQPDGVLLIISTANGAEVARLAGPCSACTRPLRWVGRPARRWVPAQLLHLCTARKLPRAPGRHQLPAAASSWLLLLCRCGPPQAGDHPSRRPRDCGRRQLGALDEPERVPRGRLWQRQRRRRRGQQRRRWHLWLLPAGQRAAGDPAQQRGQDLVQRLRGLPALRAQAAAQPGHPLHQLPGGPGGAAVCGLRPQGGQPPALPQGMPRLRGRRRQLHGGPGMQAQCTSSQACPQPLAAQPSRPSAPVDAPCLLPASQPASQPASPAFPP